MGRRSRAAGSGAATHGTIIARRCSALGTARGLLRAGLAVIAHGIRVEHGPCKPVAHDHVEQVVDEADNRDVTPRRLGTQTHDEGVIDLDHRPGVTFACCGPGARHTAAIDTDGLAGVKAARSAFTKPGASLSPSRRGG